MSKIGRKPLILPSGVEASVADRLLTVKGPKGTLTLSFDKKVRINKADSSLAVERLDESKPARMMHGTTRSLAANMIKGVLTGFRTGLIIEGIGFKASVQGKELVLEVGYTHPVKLEIPADLTVKTEKGAISVEGIDKQKVGQFAAIIRSQKLPDAYKGKGIRYEDEVLHLKPGKKAAAATTA